MADEVPEQATQSLSDDAVEAEEVVQPSKAGSPESDDDSITFTSGGGKDEVISEDGVSPQVDDSEDRATPVDVTIPVASVPDLVSDIDDSGKLSGTGSSARLSSPIDIEKLSRNQQEVADVPEVKGFVLSLLESFSDKQDDIYFEALATLQRIGQKHPATVLRTLLDFILSQNKAGVRLHTTVITIMENCINSAVEAGQLDFILASRLMTFALDEMTSVDLLEDLQNPASNILVFIGTVYCKDVLQLLMQRLQPNSIPHQCVISTLGSLATQNIYGTVPQLKEILGKLIPMLSQVKGNVMKWSFARALAKISEALLFYFANVDRAPDPFLRREWFAEEIGQAFDVLYSSWLTSKVPKISQEVLEALGFMSQLLPEARLLEVASKLIGSLLSAYKSPVEALYVSRCLALVLEALYVNPNESLDGYLYDQLLSALFHQVGSTPDYSQPGTVKNHYEVLRCFEGLARARLEKVLAFLLAKLENTSEKTRVASLTVLKHLLNSLKDQLSPHISNIHAQLKPLMQDGQNRVRKILAQTVVAMAMQGFLDLNVGSSDMITFLLKLCALEDEPSGSSSVSSGLDSFLNRGALPTAVSNAELRQMCENVVHLLATTQPALQQILWPHLLIYITNRDLNRAMGVISKALAYLALKRLQENPGEPYKTGSCTHGSLPSSGSVVARFLVLASSPWVSERGPACLQFLKYFSPLINNKLGKIWDEEISQLLSKLKEMKAENWEDDKFDWLNTLQNFADLSLAEMKAELPEWTQDFSSALLEQLPLYEADHTERGFLLTLVGLAVHHGVIQQGPAYGVEVIFSSVRHQFLDESLGCATAMGVCARSHFDVVALRLHSMERNDYGRKPSGLLGFMKEGRSEAEADLLKATAARCFGRIAVECPSIELMAKVEKHIVHGVLYTLQSSRNTQVKEAGLEAVQRIARSLLPDKLQERFFLPGRADLLKEARNQLESIPVPDSCGKGGPMNSHREAAKLCTKAIDAISSLVLLPPCLVGNDQTILLQGAFDHGMPLFTKLSRNLNEDKNQKFRRAMELEARDLLRSMEHLTLNILREGLNPATLDGVFALLYPWSKAKHAVSRKSSLNIFKLALELYCDEIKFEPGIPTRFTEGFHMIAKFLPRCADPKSGVRELTVDIVGLLLKIVSKYQGYDDDFKDATIEALQNLKAGLGAPDPMESLLQLAGILISKVSSGELWNFVEIVASGLVDLFPTSSSGACVILCLLLKARGPEIHLHAKDLLAILLSRLALIECPQTRKSIFNAISILASQQLDPVVSSLLTRSVTSNADISDCWKVLASDRSLGVQVLEYLMDIISYAAPYENNSGGNLIASFRLFSAVCALKNLVQEDELSNALQLHFAALLTDLLLVLGVFLGASPPVFNPASGDKLSFIPNREAYKMSPFRVTAETLSAFLKCVNLSPLAQPVSEPRQLDNTGDVDLFCELVSSQAALVTHYASAQLPKVVSLLATPLKSSLDRHRIVAATFYAELVEQRCGGRAGELLETLVTGLSASLADSNVHVRRAALRGLGAIGAYDQRLVNTFSPAVLNALLAGLEDDSREKYDGTVKEALEGLDRVLPIAPAAEAERITTRLALRIRTFFENEDHRVRKAAFSLLGDLFQISSPTLLSDQVHATLISLLLHLNETDPEVIRCCKTALRNAGPLLESESVNAMLQTHLPDQGKLNYPAFLADLARLITADLQDWVESTYLNAAVSYFKSPVPELRANAALIVGFLCGNLKTEPKNFRKICLSLTHLLHDANKMVKMNAMKSVSAIYGCFPQ